MSIMLSEWSNLQDIVATASSRIPNKKARQLRHGTALEDQAIHVYDTWYRGGSRIFKWRERKRLRASSLRAKRKVPIGRGPGREFSFYT